MEKKLTCSFRDLEKDGKVSLTSDPNDKNNILLDVNGTKIFIKLVDLEEAIHEINMFNGQPLVVPEGFKFVGDISPGSITHIQTNDFLDCKVELGKVSGVTPEQLEEAMINNSIPATIFNDDEAPF